MSSPSPTPSSRSREVGRKFSVPSYTDVDDLLAVKDIRVVHVATPPSTHHDLVMKAIAAGKNVLCEKPLATEVADAVGMLNAAADAGVIVPVNFVLRHNAVTDAVSAVLESGVLGEVLSAWLINCAADSNLPADHWFWNRRVSGGIFIEHGVHFFDLYRHWLGPGELIAARAMTRPGTDQQDRVECTLRYGEAVVHHYHGFDQVAAMDRTEHRILCELGDIRVSGWIPLTMTVEAALDGAGVDALVECCPGAEMVHEDLLLPALADTNGRGKPRHLSRRVELSFTPQPDKQAAYAASVRTLLADQVAYIRNATHGRCVSDTDGLDALKTAVAARDLAANQGA